MNDSRVVSCAPRNINIASRRLQSKCEGVEFGFSLTLRGELNKRLLTTSDEVHTVAPKRVSQEFYEPR